MAEKKKENKTLKESLDEIAESIDEDGKKILEVRKGRPQKGNYIGAIIANIVLYLIFNRLPEWDIPFLTEDFKQVLPFLNITLIATIIANILFFFYDSSWFQAFSRFILAGLGILFMYMLYTIFPFDFSFLENSELIELLMRFSLIVGMLGTVIAALFEFWRLILGVRKR